MALHHTQIKKLSAAGLTADIDSAGTIRIQMQGVTLASGPEANAKALIAEAINQTEDEDFDLDAIREENETGDEAEVEEGETQGALAKTIARYRNKYKEIGANDSNGDALALALRAHTYRAGEKARDGQSDLRALRDVLDQNGLPTPRDGINPGHTRMIYGNVLRGAWKRGQAIIVGSETIEPTPEALERKAQLMAKEEAKANRVPRTKQTDEERKAKAKAARAKRKAEKASAHEPEQAEAQAA